MKSMATSFLGRQIIGQVSAFRKSSERKPIKIQQHVYNDWSAMFKNNMWGIFFNLQLLKRLFQSINCWLLLLSWIWKRFSVEFFELIPIKPTCICSKLTIKTPEQRMMFLTSFWCHSLLLTLSRFCTFFWCFHIDIQQVNADWLEWGVLLI